MELGDLFNLYGSDKERNGYVPLYQTLFRTKQENEVSLLEVGIGTMIEGAHSSMVGYALPNYKPGGSLRAWQAAAGSRLAVSAPHPFYHEC